MKKQSVATLVLVALSIAIVLTSDEVLVMDEAIWNEVRGAEAFEDLWGHRVEWTREEDGWDERKKRDLLAIHVQNEMQPTLVRTPTHIITASASSFFSPSFSFFFFYPNLFFRFQPSPSLASRRCPSRRSSTASSSTTAVPST